MGRIGAILLAVVVGGAVAPALALGLHLPLWLDGGIAAMGSAGTYLLVRRPKPGEGLDAGPIAAGRNRTGRALADDGQAALERLRRAARQIKDRPMREQIEALGATAARVLADVRAEPAKAMAVRRLLTFYLPNAASLAEGWRALETRMTPSPERAAQTRQTVATLGQAFDQFADDLAEPQMQTLDLDLKVLNDALKNDLEQS
jgi:hypothetical protein